MTVQIHADSLTCPNTDGRWSCAWDATGAAHGDSFVVQLQATDQFGGSSGWVDWGNLIVDTQAPTLTLDLTATNVLSGSLLPDSAFVLYGEIADGAGIDQVEGCFDGTCSSADSYLETPAWVSLDDVPAAPIAIDHTHTCGGNELVRTFTVTDSFSLGEASVGLQVEQTLRDQLVVQLESPAGTVVQLLTDDNRVESDYDHYNLFLNDSAFTSYDQAGDDRLTASLFGRESRPADPLRAFRGEDSAGSWTLSLCHTDPTADVGAYHQARLVLRPLSTAAQAGRWSFTTPSIAGLDYVSQTVTVFGADLVGNRSADPLAFSVIVDNVPPTLTVESMLAEATFTSTLQVLTGTAGDGGMVSNIMVSVQNPAGQVATERINLEGSRWHYDLHPTVPGTYLVWVSAGDLIGNVTTIGPFEITVRGYQEIYLPLVMNGQGAVAAPAPDLVVDQVLATPDTIQVTIRNQGDAPVDDAFWVDMYLDPDPPPSQVNQIWEDLAEQGLVWGVTKSLQPGELVVLTVGDAYYHPDHSQVSWPLPAGTELWVQVDSAAAGSSYGAVLESHEILSQPYNNIFGPVSLIPMANAPAGLLSPATRDYRSETALPLRPQEERDR